MTPELTIGMAHCRDADGVWMTIQSLRMHHADAIGRCELVVVDDSPGSAESKAVADLCRLSGGRFVPHDGPGGTSATRQQIFREARAPLVMVVDCHVLLEQGAVSGLIEWDSLQSGPSICHGPLRAEDLGRWMTHFDDVWRGGMWGTWGDAWRCCGTILAPAQSPNGPDDWCQWRILETQEDVDRCPDCARELPRIVWAGHVPKLRDFGLAQVGCDQGDEPFPIPGAGLGLFACRRDDWPGFHAEQRGFGGEELWIHEKARRLGMRTYCLPFLQWCHRFIRPGGAPYAVSRAQTARNYVVEFRSLGLDTEPIRRHFVDSGAIGEQEWEEAIA